PRRRRRAAGGPGAPAGGPGAGPHPRWCARPAGRHPQVFVPRQLTVSARLAGTAPGLYRAPARRFGQLSCRATRAGAGCLRPGDLVPVGRGQARQTAIICTWLPQSLDMSSMSEVSMATGLGWRSATSATVASMAYLWPCSFASLSSVADALAAWAVTGSTLTRDRTQFSRAMFTPGRLTSMIGVALKDRSGPVCVE